MFHHSELFSENPGYNLLESRFSWAYRIDLWEFEYIVPKIKAGMLVEVEFFTDTVMKSEKYSEKSSFRKIVPTVFAEKFRMMKHKPYEWFKMI